MPKVLGDKEAQVRALREARASGTRLMKSGPYKGLRFGVAGPEVVRAIMDGQKPKETTVKKKSKTPKAKKAKGRKTKLHPMIKSVTSTDRKTTRIKASAAKRGRAARPSKSPIVRAEVSAKPNGPVPALKVAEFMARPNGASMAELVAEFGIEAHPMRAKIHYVRHNMAGWDVPEPVEGRYHATFKEPK